MRPTWCTRTARRRVGGRYGPTSRSDTEYGTGSDAELAVVDGDALGRRRRAPIHDVALVHLSSDAVLRRRAPAPFTEDDAPGPRSHAYGRRRSVRPRSAWRRPCPTPQICPHALGRRAADRARPVGHRRWAADTRRPGRSGRPPCSTDEIRARSAADDLGRARSRDGHGPAPPRSGRGGGPGRGAPSAATTSASSWPRPTAWTLRRSRRRRAVGTLDRKQLRWSTRRAARSEPAADAPPSDESSTGRGPVTEWTHQGGLLVKVSTQVARTRAASPSRSRRSRTLETAGLDLVYVAEAYGIDAVSSHGVPRGGHRDGRDRVGHPSDLHPDARR